MIILGLNDSNSASAIIKDGVLIAAVREERFSRIKFDDSFPLRAVEYCLNEAGIQSIEDIDQIVFAKKNKRISSIRNNLKFIDGKEMKILFAPHHLCHACSSFFVSPFKDAGILTIDSYGDDITTQFYLGTGNRIEVLNTIFYPYSIGLVYAAITQYLGFRPIQMSGR